MSKKLPFTDIEIPEPGDTDWGQTLNTALEGFDSHFQQAKSERERLEKRIDDLERELELNRIQWSFETGDIVYSSPTIVDGTVYVGSYDKHLYSLDANTGEKLWSFEVGQGVPDWDDFHREGVKSSPQVVNGAVFFGANDRHLYALDAKTGEEKWRFKTENVLYSSPTVVDGVVYVSSRQSQLYCLDSESGELLWQSSALGGPSGVSPTVINGRVFSGSYGNRVVAFDKESGEEVWRHEGDETCSSPTVKDGTVFIGSLDNAMLALDEETGEVVWRHELESFPDQSSPTVKNGTVFIGAYTGFTHAFDTETGDEIWRARTTGPGYTSPTVVDDTVFIQGKKGFLYEIDAASGDIREKIKIIQKPDNVEDPKTFRVSSPIVVDGILYVGTIDHHVIAFRTNVDGSSNGTRVKLGTLNHHESWKGTSPQ